jgi:hypothetical protein
MSDDRLRELERRWRQTGALGDRAAYLRERARSGQLEPERLRLAAFLGSEVAATALSEESSALGSAGEMDLDSWVTEVAAYGVVALKRLAIAAANHVGHRLTSSGVPPRAVEAAEEQLLCPCDAHRAEALHQADEVANLSDVPMRTPGFMAAAAEHAARAAAAESAAEVLKAALLTSRAAQTGFGVFPTLTGVVSLSDSDEPVRAGIRPELLAWALDEADPVRERVQRRRAQL